MLIPLKKNVITAFPNFTFNFVFDLFGGAGLEPTKGRLGPVSYTHLTLPTKA